MIPSQLLRLIHDLTRTLKSLSFTRLKYSWRQHCSSNTSIIQSVLITAMMGHVTLAAKYVFYGNPYQHQLSFPQNASIVVNNRQYPSNGWILGRVAGRKGWFPVSYVNYRPPPPAIPPPPPPTQGYLHEKSSGKTISQKSVLDSSAAYPPPVDSPQSPPSLGFGSIIAPACDENEGGFDPEKIMGGQIRTTSPIRTLVAPPTTNEKQNQDVLLNGGKSSGGPPSFLKAFSNIHSKVRPISNTSSTIEWNAQPQIEYDGEVIRDYSSKKRGMFNLRR